MTAGIALTEKKWFKFSNNKFSKMNFHKNVSGVYISTYFSLPELQVITYKSEIFRHHYKSYLQYAKNI